MFLGHSSHLFSVSALDVRWIAEALTKLLSFLLTLESLESRLKKIVKNSLHAGLLVILGQLFEILKLDFLVTSQKVEVGLLSKEL